jgi:hypothetical protein
VAFGVGLIDASELMLTIDPPQSFVEERLVAAE